MYKKLTLIVSVTLALALAVTPAAAITYGEPDGNRHPNVGLMLGDLNGDGTVDPSCSGTLIASTVFLTAGHCTRGFLARGIPGWVTFDSQYDPQSSQLIPIAAFITNPDFDPNTYFNDVGVVILAEPVQGVTPASLPAANLLDQMKAAGALKDQAFVNVGYGATAEFKGMPPALSRDGMRRFSIAAYSALTQDDLHLLGNNDATDGGGICFGDSGAPQFLGDTGVIASIGSTLDAVCRSLEMSQRLDIASVQAFLANYVTLP